MFGETHKIYNVSKIFWVDRRNLSYVNNENFKQYVDLEKLELKRYTCYNKIRNNPLSFKKCFRYQRMQFLAKNPVQNAIPPNLKLYLYSVDWVSKSIHSKTSIKFSF